jgi:hypothetical protein
MGLTKPLQQLHLHQISSYAKLGTAEFGCETLVETGLIRSLQGFHTPFIDELITNDLAVSTFLML